MGTSKILIDGVGIDLTQDTVAANKMLSGTKAHDSNGDIVTGNIPSYDGTVENYGMLPTKGEIITMDLGAPTPYAGIANQYRVISVNGNIAESCSNVRRGANRL